MIRSAAYRAAFVRRVRRSRGTRTHAEVAGALQIDASRYAKYETRSLLPHHLIEPFCLFTGADLVWLVTGRKPPRPRSNIPQK